MSASILKIDIYAGGSGTMPAKLMAYVMSGLELALFYIYIMRTSVFPHQ